MKLQIINQLKIVSIGALAVLIAGVNVGCDENELAVGIVAGTIIGAAVSDDDDGHSHRRGHHRKNKKHHRKGHGKGRGHGGGHRGGGFGHHDMEFATFAAPSGTSSLTQNLMTKFGLHKDSAQSLASIFAATQMGQWSALGDLGMSQKDISKLSRMRMPSQKGINNFAKAINVDYEKSQQLLATVVAEGRAQFANVESEAWEVCLTTTGKWKTPQNLSCSRLSSQGCSPATGATQCAPK